MPALYLATLHSAGEECSSTYEGRHVTLEETYLTHPTHADGFVDRGDPVIFGENGVGVAFTSAGAATDLISLDTEGIWFLNVLGCISDGTSDGIAHALAVGDPVYINKSTCVLSGQDDPYHFLPFGYVLGTVAAHTTSPTLVAVKVHWAPNFLDLLNIGSGSTDPYLLEGDPTVRQDTWLRAAIAPSTPLVAGEQLHGFNIRLENNLVSTGGELTAGELKVVNNAAATTLAALTGLKIDVDNKVSGVTSDGEFAIQIMMEGAGGAPAIRSGIQFNSDGTAGTLEGWFNAASPTALGLKANVAAPGNTVYEIPVIIGGTRYCIPVCAWV